MVLVLASYFGAAVLLLVLLGFILRYGEGE